MAYKTEELFEKAKELVQKRNLFFIEDIVAYLVLSKATFYEHFPLESYEMNTLKEMLTLNRMNTKNILRKQMLDANTSTDRIALYKLIGEPEEYRRLSNIDKQQQSEGNGSITVNIVKPTKTLEDAIESGELDLNSNEYV